MHHPNFCAECGAQLKRKGWRVWQRRTFCEECARRLGKNGVARSLTVIAVIAISAFALGRYLRPAPPPLIIERTSNSPLSDLPVNVNEPARKSNHQDNSTKDPARVVQSQDDPEYICGARTKKGTPCRRRVHFAGERCFQHKGMPAMLPIDKLIMKGAVSSKQ
jgi:hypothetical protein